MTFELFSRLDSTDKGIRSFATYESIMGISPHFSPRAEKCGKKVIF